MYHDFMNIECENATMSTYGESGANPAVDAVTLI